MKAIDIGEAGRTHIVAVEAGRLPLCFEIHGSESRVVTCDDESAAIRVLLRAFTGGSKVKAQTIRPGQTH